MSLDAATVKARLLTRLEEYCFHLFPAGSVINGEFRVGDITGRKSRHGKGGSLAICLKGPAAGLWHDHADVGSKGDVFDLWIQHHNTTFKDAFPEICRWAGVNHIDRPKPKAKPPKPDTSGLGAMQGTPALKYLTEVRGLNVETLKAYKIRSHKRPSEHNTDFVAFQFATPDGDMVMLKSTGIAPKADGKKDTWTTAPYYTLWGWWTVKPSDRAIIVTEGEYDAMSVHQMNPGIPVLSLPAGASNLTWIENDFDAVQRFERIYICTDADDAGEKCAQEMAKRLGLARCFRIKPPAPFKDANQFLTESEDETGVDAWLTAAQSYDPPTLRGSGSFREDVKARIKREKAEDAVNTFVFPDIPFQYRPGECTLLTGYTGHGKSEFMYQSLVHEMGNGERICIASMEIDAAEMIANIGTQLIGHKPTDDAEVDRVIDWLDGRLWFVSPKDGDDDKPTSSAELFADFDYSVARFNVTRLAIDSLMFLVGKDDYEAQDALAKACRNFCRKKHPQTHVILIAHSAIKQGEDKMPTAAAVQGSTGILAPFNNIVTVWRNVDKEEKMEKAEGDEAKLTELAKLHDGILKIWKQRRTGKRPRAKLWFDATAKRFRTKQDDTIPPTIETAKEKTEDLPF
jgi:twinkle protein